MVAKAHRATLNLNACWKHRLYLMSAQCDSSVSKYEQKDKKLSVKNQSTPLLDLLARLQSVVYGIAGIARP